MIKPYFQDDYVTVYHGDNRDLLPELLPDSIDFTITDPPYGVNKAEWDGEFPTFWMPDVARITKQAIAIMPGTCNIISCPSTIGDFEYLWALSIEIRNGMTRGKMGFGNWIPVVVYNKPGVSLYRAQQDATSISIVGEMPEHPSPKPLHAMTWLLSRFGDGSVLDPFMGSGTTLVAAKGAGRKAIGIEREERYCEEAANRLSQEVLML